LIVSALLALVPPGPGNAQGARPGLALVSARDHLEVALLNDSSVYADASRIYLAGTTADNAGRLYVLARDQATNFPVLQSIDFPEPLSGVRGDRDRLYVVGGTKLYVFSKTRLALSAARVLDLNASVRAPGSDIAVAGGHVYLGLGQAQIAVNSKRVVLAALSDGETAVEVDPATLAITRTYGSPFVSDQVQVFARDTGALITSFPFGPTVFGNPGFPRLYMDNRVAIATRGAGCCGTGYDVREPVSLALRTSVQRLWVNTVTHQGKWLIAGRESGHVELFGVRSPADDPVVSTDLRTLTGHTGIEDIEIRSVWADGYDNLVFAGSTWGNDTSRGPDLPSFFVLALTNR
jgi:hypothetical protein